MLDIDSIMNGVIYVVTSYDNISSFEDELMFKTHVNVVYNEIVRDQSILHKTDRPYLLGTFFSYIVEYINSQKSPIINPYKRVCLENAMYCFMRCINENEIMSRKQAGAMRMLLLMRENSYDCFNLVLRLNDNVPHFDVIAETKALINRVEIHCYNLYANDENHYMLDSKRMQRLQECIKKSENLNRKWLTTDTNSTWELWFAMLNFELEIPTYEYRFDEITEDDLESHTTRFYY